MKKTIVLIVTVLALLLITTSVLACPPKPQCAEGEITVTESQYIPKITDKVCVGKLTGHTYPDSWCKKGSWVTKWKTVVIQQEGWTKPVCRVPVGGCTDPLAINYVEGDYDFDDETCEYKQGCAFTMYVLTGNGSCSLTRNYGLEDSAGKIPSRFVNGGELTGYGQELCNQCRTTEFKWDGGWTTTCDVPCVDCQ